MTVADKWQFSLCNTLFFFMQGQVEVWKAFKLNWLSAALFWCHKSQHVNGTIFKHIFQCKKVINSGYNQLNIRIFSNTSLFSQLYLENMWKPTAHFHWSYQRENDMFVLQLVGWLQECFITKEFTKSLNKNNSRT